MKAAFFQEILLQPADLPVQQVIGLMNQADGDVGYHLGRAGFAELPVGLIDPIDPIVLSEEPRAFKAKGPACFHVSAPAGRMLRNGRQTRQAV